MRLFHTPFTSKSSMEEGKSENEWLALHITMQSYNFTYNAMQDK